MTKARRRARRGVILLKDLAPSHEVVGGAAKGAGRVFGAAVGATGAGSDSDRPGQVPRIRPAEAPKKKK